MKQALETLENLRLRIMQRGATDAEPEDREYIAISSSKNTIDLSFYGSPFGESYLDLLECAGAPAVSGWIRSISFSAPDEGTNGTKNWNLEPLVAHSPSFERLEMLSIQLNQPGDHNRSIVGDMYEENGMIARILERAPHLRSLRVPSAPNATFFRKPADNLEFLSVDAGFSTQDFIANLAASSNLRALRYLEWGEYQETYMENWESQCTPFADYQRLFAAPVFRKVSAFVWRNPVCSDEQIKELKSSRKDLQVLVVRSSAEYA